MGIGPSSPGKVIDFSSVVAVTLLSLAADQRGHQEV